jgi:arylsulfatase A-like enzyme
VLAVLAGLAAAAGCTLGRSPAETSSSATEEEERPNVLLLAVDDLRPLIGAYAEGPPTNASGTGGAGAGPPPAPTPHIDALAADGTLFQRAFTHYAVCAPSRATLLTGMRPDSLDMWVNQVPVRELVPGIVTLPQYFRQNGYYTASIGFKTFHNPDPPSWDERVKVDIRKNKDRIGPGRYYDPQAIAAMKKPGGGRQRGPTYEHPEVPDTAYTDGEAAGRAVEALRRVSEERPEQPFFMSVGFLRPHLPFNCPDRYWKAAGEETQKLPDNYFEPKNVTKFSLSNFGELRSYAGIPDEGPVPKEIGRGMNRAYRACVSYVDAQIGRVMDELRAQGMAENTIVVFWGDHGFKLGEHKSWSKHTVYEIDTRVPLIVRTPEGLPGAAPGEGQYTDALVETVDVYPTLAQLAGLPVPRQPQGISFVPLLENPDRPWKEAAFMQYGRGAGQSIGVMGRAVRTDRYRYVEWQREPGQPQGKLEAGGEVLARELYDHRSDPAENVNVAGQAEYAETVERLSRMLNEGRKQALPEGVEPSR